MASDEVPPGYARVECKCPTYEGSDFWNDPHRWCGVNPVTEKVWDKQGQSDCDCTFKKLPVPYNPYQNMMADYQRMGLLGGSSYHRQLGMMDQLLNPFWRL